MSEGFGGSQQRCWHVSDSVVFFFTILFLLECIVNYQNERFKGELRLFDRELFLLVVAVGSENAWNESSSANYTLQLDLLRAWGRSKVENGAGEIPPEACRSGPNTKI